MMPPATPETFVTNAVSAPDARTAPRAINQVLVSISEKSVFPVSAAVRAARIATTRATRPLM
jgi:hypothetical protein